MPSSRLLVVGMAVLAVLAGCTGAPAGDTGPTATDPATDDPTTTPTTDDTTTTDDYEEPGDDGYYNAFTFRASEVSPADVARALATPVDRADERGQNVARTVVDGGSTLTTVIEPADDGVAPSDGPLDPGEFLRDDGVVYRVSGAVVDQFEGEGYQMEVDGPIRPRRDEYETAQNRAVPVEDLSAAERRAFGFVLPDDFDPESGSVIANRRYLPPSGDSLAESAWADGDPAYVQSGEYLYRVQVEEREQLVRATVRYEVETVADSLSAFGQERLSGVVTNVTETTPPAPARSVLLNATEQTVVEWEGVVKERPEEIDAAADWVRQRPPETNVAFVRHQGELYRITVQEVIE